MGIEVGAAAVTGATSTVAGLMVTEVWTRARSLLTRVFRRQSQHGALSEADAELRSAFEDLAAAVQDDGPFARADASDRLRRRWRHALREGSPAAHELLGLLTELEQENRPAVAAARAAVAGALPPGISYAVPTAPPPLRPPSQVAARRSAFINRREELAAMHASATGRAGESAHVDLTVLRGPRGVGTTALAQEWSRQSRDRFPDGQLYVDYAELRSRTDRAGGRDTDVSDALGHCLRSLGAASETLPPSLSGLVRRYRELTSGRKLLLLLDHVSSPAQVRSLIPNGPGSAVVVTSTKKLDDLVFEHARPVHVEPLSLDASLLLLRDRCGERRIDAEPDAARRVAELCAGLPIALHIAAARVLNDRHLTVSALADELRDENRRLSALDAGGDHSVSAVLDSSYHELPPHLAHGYRLLGWIPGDAFDLATAAAALAVEDSAAQVLLDVLEDMSLVEATPERRYRFPGLVRLHARERARAEEPSGAERAVAARVLRHRLVLTAFADRAVRADRSRQADLTALLADHADPFASEAGPEPLDWLEAERPNLMATLRAAGEHRLYAQGWQLAEALIILFLHHRHLGDWRESLELGAAYASADVAPHAEARLRSMLTRPLLDLREYGQARRELESALAGAETAGDPVLHASVLEMFGRYWERTDLTRAIDSYRRSIDLNERGGEPRGAAIATFFLGRAQDAQGDTATALTTLARARTDLLGLADPDRRMAARATAALGLAQDHAGRTAEAVASLRAAAEELRAHEAYAYEAEALLALADIAERPGADRSRLRDDVARALAVHEEMGSSPTVIETIRTRLHRLG